MSWREAAGGRPVKAGCRRRAALAGLLGAGLLLGGCGFHPLYATRTPGAGVADQFAQVQIALIPDRSGQILRNYLIQRLNPQGYPADPRYRLEVTVDERRQDLGIQKDASATRANLITNASLRLTDLASRQVVLTRSLGAITSYSILLDQFATLVSERDARDRALRQLSDDIATALGLYFARQQAA